MTNNIVMLKEINNFVNEMTEKVTGMANVYVNKNEAYNEKNHMFSFYIMVENFYKRYYMQILNINEKSDAELENWMYLFVTRFMDLLPLLYLENKILITRGNESIEPDVQQSFSNYNSITGENSTEHSINTPRDKYGTLRYSDGENKIGSLFANLSAMNKFSANANLENFISNFHDLFIYPHFQLERKC